MIVALLQGHSLVHKNYVADGIDKESGTEVEGNVLGPNEWAHVKKVFQLLHETLEVEVDEGENCKSALTAEMKEQILLYGHSGTCKSHGKGGIVTGLLSLLNNVDE